jgi:hypothetical protein
MGAVAALGMIGWCAWFMVRRENRALKIRVQELETGIKDVIG